LAWHHYWLAAGSISLALITVAAHVLASVLHRREELALLLALGWRASAVTWLIASETALSALAGGLVGSGLALGVIVAATQRIEAIVLLILPALVVGLGGLAAVLSALVVRALDTRRQFHALSAAEISSVPG
jgi:ABC-type antimicrobial peptide transport system permease subunit